MRKNLWIERLDKQCIIKPIESPDMEPVLDISLIRQINRNLARFFDLYEFMLVKGRKDMEQMPTPDGIIRLTAKASRRNEQYVMFYAISPLLIQHDFDELSARQREAVTEELGLAEPITRQQYMLYSPQVFNIVAVDSLFTLIKSLESIGCKTIKDLFPVLCKLCRAVQTLEDGHELVFDYADEGIFDIIVDKWKDRVGEYVDSRDPMLEAPVQAAGEITAQQEYLPETELQEAIRLATAPDSQAWETVPEAAALPEPVIAAPEPAAEPEIVAAIKPEGAPAVEGGFFRWEDAGGQAAGNEVHDADKTPPVALQAEMAAVQVEKAPGEEPGAPAFSDAPDEQLPQAGELSDTAAAAPDTQDDLNVGEARRMVESAQSRLGALLSEQTDVEPPQIPQALKETTAKRQLFGPKLKMPQMKAIEIELTPPPASPVVEQNLEMPLLRKPRPQMPDPKTMQALGEALDTPVPAASDYLPSQEELLAFFGTPAEGTDSYQKSREALHRWMDQDIVAPNIDVQVPDVVLQSLGMPVKEVTTFSGELKEHAADVMAEVPLEVSGQEHAQLDAYLEKVMEAMDAVSVEVVGIQLPPQEKERPPAPYEQPPEDMMGERAEDARRWRISFEEETFKEEAFEEEAETSPEPVSAPAAKTREEIVPAAERPPAEAPPAADESIILPPDVPEKTAMPPAGGAPVMTPPQQKARQQQGIQAEKTQAAPEKVIVLPPAMPEPEAQAEQVSREPQALAEPAQAPQTQDDAPEQPTEKAAPQKIQPAEAPQEVLPEVKPLEIKHLTPEEQEALTAIVEFEEMQGLLAVDQKTPTQKALEDPELVAINRQEKALMEKLEALRKNESEDSRGMQEILEQLDELIARKLEVVKAAAIKRHEEERALRLKQEREREKYLHLVPDSASYAPPSEQSTAAKQAIVTRNKRTARHTASWIKKRQKKQK
ncbi:MAG: hypothetical protein ACOX88_04335 [Christensenellales bacterium]|jgi:hypothetical protein